jgi:thiamine biosynthesis lipoprotein
MEWRRLKLAHHKARQKEIITIVVLICCICISGCSANKYEEHKREAFALDTIITLTAYGGKNVDKAIDEAIYRIQEIEEHMSTTIDDSDISKINKNAGKAPVIVHKDTLYVLDKALEYCSMSNGMFDITIYPLIKLWDIKSEHPRVPSAEEIQGALKYVDYKKIVVDRDKNSVYLMEKGMGIDLGAIAKGYAADEVTRIFKKYGIEHALINLGGNIMAIGNKVDGSKWNIGVQNPRTSKGNEGYFAVLEVSDSAVVSSGDYQRYMVKIYEETGKRYHHIFDPKTGYPADKGIIATTVISPLSIDADALSTCLFVMGYEGFNIIDELEGVDALLVSTDKKVTLSKKFSVPINITDREYGYKK